MCKPWKEFRHKVVRCAKAGTSVVWPHSKSILARCIHAINTRKAKVIRRAYNVKLKIYLLWRTYVELV